MVLDKGQISPTYIQIVYRTVSRNDQKFGLYADDIIIMCTNPQHYIAALLEILPEFIDFSYYKLNISKSMIFPVTNLSKQQAQLSQFQFIWADTSFTYLGIKLFHTPTQSLEQSLELFRPN